MKPYNWLTKYTNNHRGTDMKNLKQILTAHRFDDQFTEVVEWVEGKAATLELDSVPRKKNHNGSILKMIRYIQSHKFRTVLATAFLALFIVACNMPLQHTETVGYAVKYSLAGSVSDPLSILPDSIMPDASSADTWISAENEQERTHVSAVIHNLTSEGLAELEAALEGNPEVLEYNFTTINETSTRPAYDVAFRQIFHISLTGDTLDPDELAAQIQSQLTAQGVEPSVIEVVLNDDGTIQFDFEFSNTGSEYQEYEMAITVEDPDSADVEIRIGASHEDTNLKTP